MILLSVLFIQAWLVFTYWYAPDNGFYFDDFDNIINVAAIRVETLSSEALIQAYQQSFLPNRPLASVSFALDWWRGDGDPRPFQLTNISLHGINALLVLFLLKWLLGRFYPDSNQKHQWLIASLCATIWALHPIQVQSVTYIVQRMNLMSSLFLMLGVLLYIRARLSAKTPWLYYLGVITSLYLGSISKENAYVAPALILLTEFGVCRHQRALGDNIIDRLLIAIPCLLVLLVLIDLITGMGPVSDYALPGYRNRDFTFAERLLTQPRIIFFHLGQIIWPTPDRFSLEHDIVYSSSLLQPISTLAAISGLLLWLLAGLTCLFKKSLRLVGFLLLWVLGTLVIESSIIPLEMIFEHRFYLPSVGLMGLLAIGLFKLWQSLSRPQWLIIPLLSLPLLLSLSSRSYIEVWSDPIKLSLNSTLHAPLSSRAWSGLSHRYLRDGQLDKAQAAALRSLSLNPNEALALEDLAIIRMEQQQYREAESLLLQVIRLEPKHPAFNHLGEVYFKQGNYRMAINYYHKARDMAPWFADYLWNIALAHERLGQCEEALMNWKQFLLMTKNQTDRESVNSHLIENYPKGQCPAVS